MLVRLVVRVATAAALVSLFATSPARAALLESLNRLQRSDLSAAVETHATLVQRIVLDQVLAPLAGDLASAAPQELRTRSTLDRFGFVLEFFFSARGMRELQGNVARSLLVAGEPDTNQAIWTLPAWERVIAVYLETSSRAQLEQDRSILENVLPARLAARLSAGICERRLTAL